MKKHTSRKDASPVMAGVVSVGARGQIVIPARARKLLKLKPGDTLVVMVMGDHACALFRPEPALAKMRGAYEELSDLIVS